MAPIRIGVVGVGKIARDQHLPSIERNPDFELVAAVSRNASVDGVTGILPFPIFLTDARLIFPENKHAPIAASMKFRDSTGVPVHAEFDWRQTGPQTWDIRVETDQGTLLLQNGGALMRIDGVPVVNASDTEYDGIYRHFATLVRSGASDVDLRPLRHVADAFMSGKHERTEAYVD